MCVTIKKRNICILRYWGRRLHSGRPGPAADREYLLVTSVLIEDGQALLVTAVTSSHVVVPGGDARPYSWWPAPTESYHSSWDYGALPSTYSPTVNIEEGRFAWPSLPGLPGMVGNTVRSSSNFTTPSCPSLAARTAMSHNRCSQS